MRPIPPRAPRLVLAALAAAALLPGCGPDSAKKELASYELAVEDLMGRDEKVTAELVDLRSDMGSGLGNGDEYLTYAKEQALPFYRHMKKTAEGLHPQAPRLEKVHQALHEFAEARAAHLEGFGPFLKQSREFDAARLMRTQQEFEAAEKALVGTTGGRISDNAVAEAVGATMVFQQRILGPYGRGQVTAKALGEAVRTELLPVFTRAADATKGDLAADGAKGAGARWVRAAEAMYRAMLELLPAQEAISASRQTIEEKWAASEDARKRFLEGFKAYRESLR